MVNIMQVALILFLVLLAGLLLPRTWRLQLRFPLIALLLHICILVLQRVSTGNALFATIEAGLKLVDLFLILLIFGRLGFLLLLAIFFNPRGSRQIPRILQDIMQGLIYAGALFFTLKNAGVQINSLIISSALITAVLGLGLQEPVGNLFSGIGLELQQPFTIGDWIQFNELERHIGKVTDINWRATKVITLDNLEVTIPNALLSKSLITNFSRPSTVTTVTIQVRASNKISPTRVHTFIYKALDNIPGVLQKPSPLVVTGDFVDNGLIEYQISFSINSFENYARLKGLVRDRIWYALERAGLHANTVMTIHQPDNVGEGETQAREREIKEIVSGLDRVEFLKPLGVPALAEIAKRLRRSLYAPGEVIFHEGEEGHDCFIVLQGEVQLTVAGKLVELLSPGSYFGVVSVLTGEPHRGTATAAGEVCLLTVGKDLFQEILNKNPLLADKVNTNADEFQHKIEQMKQLGASETITVVPHSSELFLRLKQYFSLI
jgi:small-conductance mechanosensitive channel